MEVNQVLKEIQLLKENTEQYVFGGKCPDYPEYRYNCGFLNGLARIEDHIINTLKKEQEDNE